MSPHIITSSSGFTGVFDVDEIVRSFLPKAPTPDHPFHITLISKDETRILLSSGVAPPLTSKSSLVDLVPVGVAHHRGGCFIVVVFPSAASARKTAGLPRKDFHITVSTPTGLSPNDLVHDLSTLDSDPLELPSSSPRLLDALALHHLSRGELFQALTVIEGTITRDSTSFKPFVRLGDAAARLGRHKLAMLAFGQAYDLSYAYSEAVQRYAVAGIVRAAARGTEWGSAMSQDELEALESLDGGVRNALLRPWSEELRKAVMREAEESQRVSPSHAIWSRQAVFVPSPRDAQPMHRMQRFFRWIVPFRLAVSAEPRDELDIDVLASPPLRIRHVVTLTSERTLPPHWFRNKCISNTYLPVDDFKAPSIEQIEAFLRLATNPETTPLLVHCAGGKGRAGTMVASYLCAYGFARSEARRPWEYPAMGWRQALETLRQIRPGSLESPAQEDRLRAFASHISKRGSVLPPTLAEPTTPFPYIDGPLDKSVDLLVLVGLPGSGKTWFRNALVARDPSWSHVSGDEDGGTSTVLTATSQHRRGKLIIDQVNSTVTSRKTLLDLAQHVTSPVAVLFDVSPSVCLSRAQRRTDHPTLPPGSLVIAALKQFERTLVAPQRSEGFTAVATVSSFASSLALVRRLAAPIKLFKFPRTPHLINLGAATSDDTCRPLADFSAVSGLRANITEKVDGANIAFSLDADRRILVQNRSHYIDSGTHVQFKKLGAWVERHREELDALLGEDEAFPERYILFGEWLAAVHSVHYTSLPDLFLAFDLYDRATRQFVTRVALERRICRTSINITPLLHSGRLPDEPTMLRMIQQPSSFAADRMEGVYIKLEDAECAKERGKIVRGDFITGNKHWVKGSISFNRIEDERKHD